MSEGILTPRTAENFDVFYEKYDQWTTNDSWILDFYRNWKHWENSNK